MRDVLLPIWLDRPETARRVRQPVKLVIDWATAKGYRSTLDLSGVAKALPRQPKSDSHFKAMPYDQVPAFVELLKVSGDTVSRMALQFLILTAARSGEVRGATWPEIDLEARTWTILGNRMKAGKAHVVPLSDPALAILVRAKSICTDTGAPIFPGIKGQPLSDMTMLKIMRDRALPFSVHGFGSAFKTWAVEATGFPDAVSEAALAHIDANTPRLPALGMLDYTRRNSVSGNLRALCIAGLRGPFLRSDGDALFPQTKLGIGADGGFISTGLERYGWSMSDPVRRIFRAAFEGAGLPYYPPHSFRHTLARLGEKLCQKSLILNGYIIRDRVTFDLASATNLARGLCEHNRP